MLNLQQPEIVTHATHLDVFKIWETFQGEGPNAGCPAVFVRLAGCNIQCEFCDTDYTSQRKHYTPQELVDVVGGIRREGLVVLTGGEPFRQYLAPFAEKLLEKGFDDYWLEIETNGTLWQRGFPYDHERISIICSPKLGSVDKRLHECITAWKYVLQAGQVADDGLPKTTLGNKTAVARPFNRDEVEIIVQPLDEGDELKNRANLHAAMESCLKHGYRLGLQQHKILGVE